MENEVRSSFLYAAAGVLLILAWVTWFLETPGSIEWLQWMGWVIGAGGILLIGLALLTLHLRGQPEEGQGVTQPLVVVDSGIYALIRHPLYLGWILVYTGVMAVGQYCLTVLLCLLGIGCVSVICRQEDRRLLERFGSRYEAYLDSVPAMNLVAGLMRWISRKRQARQKSTRDDEQEPKTA